MNKLNVLRYEGRPRYYLCHPIKFLRETAINLRAAWSRITKGYAAIDVWNLSDWMLDVLPPMLRKMADDGCAYPGNEEFDTAEKWQDWLHSMADVLESLQEENWSNRNEFEEEFFNLFEKNHTADGMTITWSDESHDKEIKELYWMRTQELNDEYHTLLVDTFRQLAEHFTMLWD